MLRTWRTLDTRLIVQQCAQQHILLNYVCMQTKREQNRRIPNKEAKDTRKHGRHKEYKQKKTRISSTPAEHDRGLFITIRDKNFEILGQVRMLKRRSCRTQKEKYNIHIDKMSRPRHITKHGSFHKTRVPEEPRYDHRLLQNVRGTPWEPNPGDV